MNRKNQSLQTLADCLRTNPQLASLPERVLRDLAKHTRIFHHENNDRLFSQGDEMQYVAVILRGGIRSSLVGYDGHEMSISILRRGAFYGWMSIGEPTSSPWDIYTYGRTELACIVVRDFRNVMARHPELTTLLIRGLSVRLRKSYDILANMVLETLDSRLRRMLILLSGDRSQFFDEEFPKIKITQELLGSFVKCSRPTVNKLLKKLEVDGLIEIGYGEIIVRDLHGLFPDRETEPVYFL